MPKRFGIETEDLAIGIALNLRPTQAMQQVHVKHSLDDVMRLLQLFNANRGVVYAKRSGIGSPCPSAPDPHFLNRPVLAVHKGNLVKRPAVEPILGMRMECAA